MSAGPPKAVPGFFSRVDRVLAAAIRPLVVVLSLAVAGLMVLGIFTRSVLGEPTLGLEEIILFLVMWLYMLGAALAARDRTHLSADLVQTLTDNPRTIAAMRMLATLISLVMAIAFAVWSLDLLVWGLEKKQSTAVFRLPFYLSQGSLFVCAAVFVFYLSRDLVSDIARLRTAPGKAG